MMNPTDLDAQVNEGSAQPQMQRAPHSFWQRNWPRIFLFLSFAVAVLTFFGIILNFIQIVIKPNVTLLNIYCLVFSLLALSAELRQFRWFRKISYHWMKYVYFLTYYKPRGIFYVLLGLLLLGDMAILYVAGAVAMVVGLCIIVTSFIVTLPVFDDPQERRREQEEARRYYEGRNVRPAGFLTKHLGLKEQDPHAGEAAQSTAGREGIDAAQMQQGYQPPTLPLREAGKSTTGGGPSSPGRSNASSQGAFRSPAEKHESVDNDSMDAPMPSREQQIGAALFGSGDPAAATTQTAASTMPPRQASNKRVGESQLRRDFAAAMDDDLR